MPKNTGKGGNKRRKGKNENSNDIKRQLIFKEDEQEYGQVIKTLGNSRLEVYCFDGVKRLCTIRGSMRKKIWINRDDIILISLRDFQHDRGDVIHKYNADEARTLKSYGEIPENAIIKQNNNNANDTTEQTGNDDTPFEFTDDANDTVDNNMDDIKTNEDITSGDDDPTDEDIDLNDL